MKQPSAWIFFSVCVISLGSHSVVGQELPDVALGIQPFASYHSGDFDSVNTMNGVLTVKIPLLSYPQKGELSLSFSVIFNSFGYQNVDTCIGSCLNQIQLIPYAVTGASLISSDYGPRLVMDQDIYAAGATVQEPFQGPPYLNFGRYYVITPDGAEHPLGHASDGFRSVDLGGYLFSPSVPSNYPLNLGMQNTQNGGAATLHPATGTITDSRAVQYNSTTITDPDSNTITLGSSSITDSAQRVIPIPTSTGTGGCPTISAMYQPVTSAYVWTVPVPGGTANYLFCYATVNISTGFWNGLQTQYFKDLRTSKTFLQSIVLPNGQYWGFIYDSANPQQVKPFAYGQLLKVLYPIGSPTSNTEGSLSYTYNPGASPCTTERAQGLGSGVSVTMHNEQVVTRTISDGLGNSHTWQYSGYPSSPSTTATSIVTPAGDLQTVTYEVDPTGNTCNFAETEKDAYIGDSTSNRIRKIATSYNFETIPGWPVVFAPIETAATTTESSGSSSTISRGYAPGITITESYCYTDGASGCNAGPTGPVIIGAPTSEAYTDYTGATLKTVKTTYQWQNVSAYLTANVLDIPAQVQTLDGSGTQRALANFTYDESAYSPGGTRGHPTTESHWLNTGPSPTTHTGWTSFGEKSYFIDAKGSANGNGHTIDYSYQNTSTGCYDSVVTSTLNALNQTTSGTYDCNTGLLKTYINLNSQTTTLNYDVLRRLTCVEYPDGGSTAFNIIDNALTLDKVVRLNGADACSSSSGNIDMQYAFDGLGREIHSRLLSDPSGTDYTDTTYDNMGRVASISNPYRSTSDPTYGVTTYTYDALSRKVKETEADNSVLQWCYDNTSLYGQSNCRTMLGSGNGEWIDFADEARNDWQRVSDSLSRLTRAYEPNGTSSAPSMETDYAYDSLDNLVSVTQWGGPNGSSGARNRSFTYDSLSRLLTASNPETGTITYTYDANSNIQTKADARGAQINYGNYDGLNRSPGKTYSNGNPSVTFSYDASGVNNYGIGHRTGMNDGSGSTTWTYDKMGRVSSESRTIAGINKTVSQTYMPEGSVSTITYPSSAVLAYSLDNAGRYVSLLDQTHSIQYAMSGQYAPQGAVSSLVLGFASGYSGITESNQYNKRLQPAVLAASTSAATLLSLSYNFHAGSGDNGNIWAITNNIDNSRSQTFTYDTLNRITEAQAGSRWGAAFTLDAWGNLYHAGPVSGTTVQAMSVNQQINTANQFTLLGYLYDAAGNVLSDGLNSGCGSYAYTWNAEEEATCAAGATYTYDGDGRRVEKNGGSSTPTLYWGGEEGAALAESNLSGTIVSEYMFFNDKRIARRDMSGGSVHYYLSDHLGSSNVVTSATGGILDQSDFYPYGGEYVINQSLIQHYKFTGKERDSESGNDYFGARYYVSNMGRFLSPDWSVKEEPVPYAQLGNPQTLNLYAYVGNDPLSRVDADGHIYNGSSESAGGMLDSANCTDPEACGHNSSLLSSADHGQSAQQQYGRQPDGSYKADPAEVQAAIKAGKPILEPGNPDHKSECVFACKALSHMKNIGTSQWRKGRAAVDLNDTTDIGLAIATLGSGTYPSQRGNSGIYMGHDANGGIKIVDQWPNNGPQYDHPFEHTLTRHDEGPDMDPNAYFVIIVPKP